MCYHYSLGGQPPDMDSLEWEMPFEPLYHASGFEFPQMPVITMQEPAKVQAYRWGLIPGWVKSGEDAQKLRTQTLNAKGETILRSRPSVRLCRNKGAWCRQMAFLNGWIFKSANTRIIFG